MATRTRSRIFDKLERQLNPKLWSLLVIKDANAEVLWSIDEKYRLIAATLWMEDDNFKKLGTHPSSGELARLVIQWQKSKDLTIDPRIKQLSEQV